MIAIINEIKKKCPNGFTTMSIGDLIVQNREKKRNNPEINQVYVVSNTLGLVRAENYRETTIHSEDTSNYTIVRTGMYAYNPARLNIGSIGRLKDIDGLVSPMYIVFKVNESIVLKEYFDYLIKSSHVQLQISSNIEQGARFRFEFSKWKNIQVKIPPLEIQNEIIKILDKFSDLINNLNLEKNKRNEQYAFYRNRLLNLDSSTPIFKISQKYKRLRGTPITAEKMKQIQNDKGDIKIYAGGKTSVLANEKDIENGNVIRVPALLIQSRGVIDVIYCDQPFTFKNEMWAYTNDNAISVRYLYHILKNNIIHFRELASGMGSLPQISLSATEDFEIFWPSIEIQSQIVEKLDTFDDLCGNKINSINAEINAREQQFDYYSDMLLNFKLE